MNVAEVHERASSAWDEGAEPEIAVLVCTFRRPEYLAELVAALEAQDLDIARFEVVMVDDGSGDDSWDMLQRLARATRLRLLTLHYAGNRGPAAARNLAVDRSRAPIAAFTDDDCLPAAAWLRSMLGAFTDGVDVVQGRTVPRADDLAAAGSWDHTIWVAGPSPFFETCNVAYRRSALQRVGGFDDRDELLFPDEGRGFGEDAELAWRVLESGGGSSFVPGALVHHRCVATSFSQWLGGLRHAKGFPGLARRSPLVARWLRGGVFLTSRSAAFDAAITGIVAAGVTRRWWLLLAVAPWVDGRWSDAMARTGGDRSRAAVVLAQHAVSDFVMLAALLEGSVRYRRVVL